MPKVFTQADEGTLSLIRDRKAQFYDCLNTAGVTFSVLMVENHGSGPPISAGGYPALACVAKTSQHQRAAGSPDIIFQIDAKRWLEMTEDQRAALVDHELHHIELTEDGDAPEGFALDPQGRPKITMRKHDYQFGWFTAIAERHGANSPEVTQARIMWSEDGQRLFPFLAEKLELT